MAQITMNKVQDQLEVVEELLTHVKRGFRTQVPAALVDALVLVVTLGDELSHGRKERDKRARRRARDRAAAPAGTIGLWED